MLRFVEFEGLRWAEPEAGVATFAPRFLELRAPLGETRSAATEQRGDRLRCGL